MFVKKIYVVLGITEEGYKEILGIWISENETIKFWLSVLTDLKARGVQDILIICSDGLTKIRKEIEGVYLNAVQPRCTVHLIRNSCKYLKDKDRRAFCNVSRSVYKANNEETVLKNLEECEKKWGETHPYAFKSLRDNWNEVYSMFNYVPELRKLMYTTNAIESLRKHVQYLQRMKVY